jgi:hypothetical protein
MKIVAISSEHSDRDAIALVTEPPLTPQIFEEVERRFRTPALQALSLQMASGCLTIHSERFNPELRTMLEKLLTEAEDVASGVAARKQAEVEQSEKEITLESAAAGFGLPIV